MCVSFSVEAPKEQQCCLKSTLIATTCLTSLALVAGGLAAASLLGVSLLAGTLIATFAVAILTGSLVIAAALGLFLAITLLCSFPQPVILDTTEELLAPDAWRENMRKRYGIDSSSG